MAQVMSRRGVVRHLLSQRLLLPLYPQFLLLDFGQLVLDELLAGQIAPARHLRRGQLLLLLLLMHMQMSLLYLLLRRGTSFH